MRIVTDRMLGIALGGALMLPALHGAHLLDRPLDEATGVVVDYVSQTGLEAVPADPGMVADRQLAARARALMVRSGEPAPPLGEILSNVSLARDAALRHGVPVSLVLAVIHHESRFHQEAVSPMGAVGLMQVQPATARAVARDYGLPTPRRGDLMDPETNIELGVALLRTLHEDYGTWDRALAVYNAGPAGLAAGSIRADVGPYVRGIERGVRFLSKPVPEPPANAA
jgi:soluble lytic murein transglycosylase-like protein